MQLKLSYQTIERTCKCLQFQRSFSRSTQSHCNVFVSQPSVPSWKLQQKVPEDPPAGLCWWFSFFCLLMMVCGGNEWPYI